MKIKKYKLYFTALIILFVLAIPVFGINVTYAVFAGDPNLINNTSPSGLSPQNQSLGNQSLPMSASPCGAANNIGYLICRFQGLINSIIPVLIALGVVYFVWGVISYVIADSEEVKKKGKDKMIYGIIGFAVIVGMWGLVNIVVNTFGLGNAVAPSIIEVSSSEFSTSCSLDGNSTFPDVLCYITKTINNSVIPLLFAVAIVMFIWGVVNFFIINSEEEKKRSEGKQFMIWGIVALAVMLSVWGLVGILGHTFGITDMSVLPKVKP